MARANNGGWDFVKVGGTYQYKEETFPMSSFIAMVKILEDNSTEDAYEFKLQVEESNVDPPTENGIFDVGYTKKSDGYYSGMPQFYELPEYNCHYRWVLGGGKSAHSPQRDRSVKGVRLTKLKEAENPTHPNNIKEGFAREGEFVESPVVGEPFYIGNFITSKVTEILSDNTFKTLNSIYRWEVLEPELV